MRASERDTLVLGLAVAAGALDSWSYFQLSHVFIANMTGNTILLGFSLATGAWGRAGISVLALGFYLAGVFAGTLLSKPVRAAVAGHDPDAILWPARTTFILGVELALVLLAALLAAALSPTTNSPVALLLVALGALAEGLQSAALTALNLPGIVTTYISGTWTMLAAGLAQLLNGEEKGGERAEWEKRLLMQAAVIVVYCGSAALIGWAIRLGGRSVLGWVPAVALALVVTAALLWGEPVGNAPRSR